MLQYKQSNRHPLYCVTSVVFVFAYPIKLNISTRNGFTKVLLKNFFVILTFLPMQSCKKQISAEFEWGFAVIEHNLCFKSSIIEETLKLIKPIRLNFSTFKKVTSGTFLVPLGNTYFICMKCSLLNGTINCSRINREDPEGSDIFLIVFWLILSDPLQVNLLHLFFILTFCCSSCR